MVPASHQRHPHRSYLFPRALLPLRVPSGAHGRQPCLPDPPPHAAPILGAGPLYLWTWIRLLTCGRVRGSFGRLSAIALGGENSFCLRAFRGASALEAEAARQGCAFCVRLILPFPILVRPFSH